MPGKFLASNRSHARLAYICLSDLPIETYHAYSDATMERLLESLENILDEINNPDYEVEYSVSVSC